jgi:predicted permease
VNIIMLLVARSSMRAREFALRLALGAGRGPLFRQLLAESGILVTLGSLLGWFFAVEATRLLGVWSELEVNLSPDRPVFLFTLAISALSAVLFGLAPLRTASRAGVGLVLKSSGMQTTTTRERMLTGKVLVALQMAFCVVLLFASGLLLRSLRNYQNVDLGMRAESVLAVGVHPIGAPDYSHSLVFYSQLTDRLRTLPGVQSVTLAELRPGTGWSDNAPLTIDGYLYPWENGRNMLRSNLVGPDFFATLGIPMAAGRDIGESDTQTAHRVVVVNQTLVNRYLKGIFPIGHTVGDAKHVATIVGVARDSKYASSDEEAMPMIWGSYRQQKVIQGMDVEIRASGDPLSLLPAVRRVVRDLDPNAPLAKPQLLQAGFEQTYLMPALFARLAMFFGALAATLVAVGLYGTLAYRVSRRTIEIGLRIALGAARGEVLWMIVRESLLLIGAGLAVGLPLSWFTSRLMASMLFQLSPHDSFSLVAAGSGMLLVSLVAALIPARRAASIEPMEALRAE